MEIKVNDETLATHFNELIKAQILTLFTPETRERLVNEAIRKILEDKEKYNNKTPLETAMDHAINSLTAEIVREEVINNPAIKARLQEIVNKAMQRVIFSPEREELLVTKMTDLLGNFLSSNSRW